MKILLCHNYYKTRAGEALVLEYEKQLLRDHGHEVATYTRDNADISDFSLYEKAGNFLRGFHNPRTVGDIDKIARNDRPDVAHVHNVFPLISPSLYWALKRHGIPVVQTLHNFRFICINGLLFKGTRECPSASRNKIACIMHRCFKDSLVYSAWYAAILSWHDRKKTFYEAIDRYIALNSFSKKIFVDAGFDERKLVVKPNAACVAGAGSVDDPGDYAVFAGRLSPEKGIFTLLEAAARVPDMPLKIIGSGHLDEKVRQYISNRKLEHVEFLGPQTKDAFESWLANALVTVFPSECFENCPLSVVNSLYLGTPVLAARTGGVPDFVPEEKAGWLFTRGSVDELTQRLTWIKSNISEVKAMRPKVRQWGKEQFSSERNHQRLIEIYRDAISHAESEQ